jgi:hypothetical protein
MGENKIPISERRIVIDADENDKDTYFNRDIPISFNQSHRKYGFRRISEIYGNKPDHDAMQVLEN